MKRLLPHFRQALDLSLRWQRMDQTRAGMNEALERLRDGVIVLDGTGAAIHLNRGAEVMLRNQDGVSLSKGRLAIAQREAMRLYETALNDALPASRSETVARFEIAVARPSGKPPYVVSVRPYRDADGRAGTLVFIRDSSAYWDDKRQLLRQAFGLTDAEVQLAHGLANGLSLHKYAEQNGLSINTIYTHYHRLKDKTGSVNQAVLIANLKDMTPAVD
jgi:DNA-binding CsgD family transcriptional regulator